MNTRALQPGVDDVRPQDGDRLVEVWEASVRATHRFLSEADIQFFRPLVWNDVALLEHLYCVRDMAGTLVGFAGVAAGKIEALFVHPAWHRLGIGRTLVQHAVAVLGAATVEVNQQNASAVAFYEHAGFRIVGRSDVDRMGKPFPLLHMRRE